jgi:23S rRNA (guanosine2251-2'-O)-methyltransferase
VTAALANPARRVRRLVGTAETVKELREASSQAAARLAGEVEILDRARLDDLLPRDAVHQGWAMAAEPLPEPRLDEVIAAPPPAGARQIVLLLDRVSDPHNVGAILRSAAAFGVAAVVVPEHGAPPVTGALAKAASGALEIVPLVRVANLAQALETLKDGGFWCLGLDGEAHQELSALDLAPRVALVLGAEGEGMRRLTRERCDVLVRLSTRHPWHSLNVSNAAAVALYDLTTRKL